MHRSPGEAYIQWHVPMLPLVASLLLFSCARAYSTPSSRGCPERDPSCDVEGSSSTDGKTCQDLNGVGSLDTTCLLNSNLDLDDDLFLYGSGNLEISAYVSIRCPIGGCYVVLNVSGDFKIGPYSDLVASSIAIEAASITLERHSSINTTGLGGSPPPQTSGTPSTFDGSGGGHGGRGASCTKYNKTNWGGDVYGWSTLSDPWSYGSRGGSSSVDSEYGSGGGGGRVMLKANDTLYVDGSVVAEGGEGGLKGGGGSGGSIRIHALKLWTKHWLPTQCGCSWNII